jgi:hypothetical protein
VTASTDSADSAPLRSGSVVHGLRLKLSKKGDYFLFMPQTARANGTRVDIRRAA